MTSTPPYAGRNRRRAKPSKTVIAAAVLGVAAIAFVTLCPIGLRPHIASANIERLAAYAVLGVAVSRAAGRRALAATALMMLLAFGLEAAQRFAPGRHAHLADAVVKAFGGVSGVAGHQLMFPLRRLFAQLTVVGDPAWAQTPVYVTSR
ncbi:hypothetical protein [Phenylobacterium sp.]|uniref:hypothetical protein n=1 Tax=Phenylobacterium sp. TaxID=1871053 RepID=UPI002D0E3995|nr:hypothetical protein [Phenylobacterium sp.]HLZ77097.1 hypothetical protein [Phenylobacterium sp.]